MEEKIMKKLMITVVLLAAFMAANATTYIVDLNGGGHFKSIQTAITNSSNGDTVKVWPGTYMEQVTLNKNIVLMGSGYENTIITGNFNPTVTINSGKIMWFMISSLIGSGISTSGGIVSNVVIVGCPGRGIDCVAGSPSVINCTVLSNNEGFSVTSSNAKLYVQNCIAKSNAIYDYTSGWWNIFISYSCGKASTCIGLFQSSFNSDPLFTSKKDYHISQGSPCWDTGNPSLNDPDGSVSDMGYFGGPDCPIYPVVTEMTVQPDGGNIKITAKGRANY
jgi:hypothetical protein